MKTWVEELMSGERPLGNLRPLVLRKKIRYNCFRLRTEAEGGEQAPPVPDGFKDHFEQQKWFDGWENFGVTWDVGTPMRGDHPIGDTGSEDPTEVVFRGLSLDEEWDEHLGQQFRSDMINTRRRKRLRAIQGGSKDQL